MAAISPRWEGILGIEEAQMLQAAMSEAHLVLHGPPDFPIDAEILGVCGVSAENADQNKYGWIVADFLHWKTAFHAVHSKELQTWLSSLDISEFLAGIDGVDVVSDGIIHKVLGDNNQDISSIPDNNNGFEAEFLKRLTVSARLAVMRKTTLVVLIFAPITPEQDICVDLGNQSRTYLTIDRLRQTIQDAVGNAQLAVTLVTPSPFTGGWACRPSILGPLGCPNLQNMMRLIAKSCGGAFATRFIQSFTERSTPFMTQDQRANVKYDDPMPLRPTELQVKSLHQFQRQIHESLEHHFSVFAKDHAFILQPDAARDPASFVDSWTEYAPRQGYRLETWARRWAKPRAAIDYANRFEFFGEAFGGTQESQFFHLKYLAAIELDTCPTDWNRHVSGATAELFTGFLERAMPGEYDVKRVFDAIEFRASSNILAQVLAKVFNLPLPDGVMCRYWHDTPDGVSDEHYRRLQDGFGMTNGLFEQAAVLPSEKTHEIKSVKYLRSARWLAAATAWRFENGSREDVEHFMTINVARFMDKIRDTQQTLLLEDRALQRKGLNWIAALGLGGEVQESPTKTAIQDVPAAPRAVSSPVFARPTKSTAVVMKDPEGKVVDLAAAMKTTASPGHALQQSKTPQGMVDAPAEASSKKSHLPNALKHIMTQWDALDGVDEGAQRAVSQRLMSHGPQEAWDSASTPTSTRGAELEVNAAGNKSVSTPAAHLQSWRPLSPMSLPTDAADSNGTADSKFGGSLADTRIGSQTAKPTEPVVYPNLDGMGLSTSLVLANGSEALEKLANAPSVRTAQMELKPGLGWLQDSAESLIEMDEKRNDKSLAPSKTAPAAQDLARKTAPLSPKSTLVELLGSNLSEDPLIIAQLLRKIADVMEQESVKRSADPTTEARAPESTPTTVQAKEAAHETAATSEDPRTNPTGLPAPSWETVKHTEQGTEPAEAAIGKEVGTSTDPLAVSVGVAADRSEPSPTSEYHASLEIYDATPPRTPVGGRSAGAELSGTSWMDETLTKTVLGEAVPTSTEGLFSGAKVQNSTTRQVQKLAATPVTSASFQGGVQPILAEGADFWAGLGPKFSVRPVGAEAARKSAKDGDTEATARDGPVLRAQGSAAATPAAATPAAATLAAVTPAAATPASTTPAPATLAAATPVPAHDVGAQPTLAEGTDFWAGAGPKFSVRPVGTDSAGKSIKDGNRDTLATAQESATRMNQGRAASPSATATPAASTATANAAPVAKAQDGGAQPTLAEGAGFWVGVGPRFSERPVGTESAGKLTKDGNAEITVRETLALRAQEAAAATLAMATPAAATPAAATPAAATPAAKSQDGGSQPTLAEGDDFWAGAGTKWSTRPVGVQASAKTIGNGNNEATVRQSPTRGPQEVAAPVTLTKAQGDAQPTLAEGDDFWAGAGTRWSTRPANVQASGGSTVRKSPTLGAQDPATAVPTSVTKAQGGTQPTLAQPFDDIWPREAIKSRHAAGTEVSGDSTEDGENKETAREGTTPKTQDGATPAASAASTKSQDGSQPTLAVGKDFWACAARTGFKW